MTQPNQFRFFIPTLKAYQRDGKKYVGGVASDTQLDRDNERMSPECLQKMATYGQNRLLDLLASHTAEWDDSIGDVTKLEVNPEYQLLFEAELDDENPKANRLYNRLLKGKQYGASIGGRVLDANYEFDHHTNHNIRVFQDIELDHIAVTRKPANPRTWLSAIAKAWENYQNNSQLEKTEWDTAYINNLKDECFAVIEPAYKEGKTQDKRCRHLPHHDHTGKLDPPHLRNALARMNQIKPITDSIPTEELRRQAKEHLIAHAKAEGIGEWSVRVDHSDEWDEKKEPEVESIQLKKNQPTQILEQTYSQLLTLNSKLTKNQRTEKDKELLREIIKICMELIGEDDLPTLTTIESFKDIRAGKSLLPTPPPLNQYFKDYTQEINKATTTIKQNNLKPPNPPPNPTNTTKRQNHYIIEITTAQQIDERIDKKIDEFINTLAMERWI